MNKKTNDALYEDQSYIRKHILPYVFSNPTPFNKLNSLCQAYGFLGLKYNATIIVLIWYVDYDSWNVNCKFIFGKFWEWNAIFEYNKQIEAIYKRFKAKKIEDKKIYKYEHRNEGSIESSDDSSNEVSEESYSESNDNKNDNKNDESENSDDEESDSDNRSDTNSIVVSDRISERISSFTQIREIVKNNVLNEPVKVFNNIYEFEISCRFIW
ncbi:hypothetical protein PIROE2DRAFT_3902 [Piromyces sp. E2]|nr:hypothetical protein PIROE2DRAFT_3902 [Piromyces sp. E2]|eukprot:OUM68444.1 hypothetical protein PIROE2DRAFT_3902 [Piromyces sp. E2]